MCIVRMPIHPHFHCSRLEIPFEYIRDEIESNNILYSIRFEPNRIRSQTPWFYSKAIIMCILFFSESMKLKVALIDSFEHLIIIFDIFKAFGRKISIIL
jgi:hypothetical protein